MTNQTKQSNQDSPDAEAPTIGIIGCGAITEALHLPALSRHPEVMAKAVCIDPDRSRARAMTEKFGAARAVQRYQDVLGDLDGAVVAVPARMHFPIALDLLKANVAVLCEKPLTETAGEARELVDQSVLSGVPLCVNNYRRLFPSFIKVRELIAEGHLGTVQNLEFSWGEKFDWPAATGAYFGVPARGRGVLADKGAHLLDLVCWWLGAKPEVASYEDDFMGGTEAMATLHFRLKDCVGVVRLSWLSKFSNTFQIQGDQGTVSGRLFDWNTLDLTSASGPKRKLRIPSDAKVPQDLGRVLFDNFLEVARGRAVPVVAGSDVLGSIELMDECYAGRTRMRMPWYDAWRRVAQ